MVMVSAISASLLVGRFSGGDSFSIRGKRAPMRVKVVPLFRNPHSNHWELLAKSSSDTPRIWKSSLILPGITG